MSSFQKKFESTKQDWTTPKHFFDELNAEFSFTTDLAASQDNALCQQFYTKEDNGLVQPWHGACWLNPPFGDKSSKMVDWIKRAWQETQDRDDLTVVVFIPARTNTRWWHQYCMKAAEVRFVCGRPRFGDAKHGLPQPLALIIFRKHDGETRFTSFHYSHR
jgi:phage N-6-adenine-methyltransferase